MIEAETPDELLGELADVLEVLLALAEATGFTPTELESRRLAKRTERGGFDARVYNAAVEADPAGPNLADDLERPDRYRPA